MATGLLMINCNGTRVTDNDFGIGVDIAIDIYNSKNIYMDNNSSRHASSAERFSKVGRNEVCPCGSGLKYKKCCLGRENMSTGIRSTRSTFTVGKANIVADIGVDLTDSHAHIEELNHVVPNVLGVDEFLKGLGVAPPKEILDEAFREVRSSGTTETLEHSRLKTWCMEQNINAGLWVQLAGAIGIAVFGGG
ncbi:YecA family protein [Pseudomonas sp. NY15372]|uniref:YecA family protein n=1 Tax=Pseudomonas sp. NY15372 TaxID=3400356 RepID=UPI003A857D47